jgi:hypothetical protein
LRTWERHLVNVPVPAGAKDWNNIPIPPPVDRSWMCRKAPQAAREPVDNDADGDASSDDEDDAELEPAAEMEDVGFIGELDRVFDDSEGM